jgi:hypothetical protein
MRFFRENKAVLDALSSDLLTVSDNEMEEVPVLQFDS